MPRDSRLPHRLRLAAAIALMLPLPTLAGVPQPTELDRVQVKVSTATRSERLLSDVPIRTEVLRKEDIALRAATDFSRAAELINGLRVESNCQNCNTSEVQLLGLPGAYNQLLFDGIPLLSTLGSVYGLEQIPAGFVDRIEVVKGGGSALYGPGAVAGVINLIPPLPARSGGHVQAGVDVLKGTPQKNADVRLDLVAKDADAGLSVIAQRNWNSGIDYNGDGYTEITRKNLKVGGLQAWYAPTPGTRLRLDLQVTDETRRGGNRLDQPEYLANIAESLDTKYRRGSVSWDQEFSADVDFRLAYAFADIDRDSFYGGLGDVVTDPSAPGYDPSQLDPNVAGSAASHSWRQYGRTHNPLHYIDSQLNWRLGAHALAFGVQYKHEALRDDNRNGAGQRLALLEDAAFHNLGAFIQDEWSLRDNVDLVLGARVDKNSELDHAVFSPRVALAWQATPNLKWRAGVATGFRAPEIFVEDVHVDTLGGEQVRVRNSDGLKEERALNTLFGFDWRSDPANPVWSWDATASYARIRNTFALGEIQRDDDGQLNRLRYNASGSNVLGMETNLGWQPSPQWRLTAGASWYRSRFREPQRIFDDTADGSSTVIESRDYLKTPRWSGVAQLSWMPAKPWETFVALRHTGPMSVLNNRLGELHRTRAFLVSDLGARWHRHLGAQAQQEVSVAAGVKNVFDQRQKDLEAGALRDSDYVYGPRFARSWYVNLRYAF